MKKILAALLTLGVIVTITSCGKQPEPLNDNLILEFVSEHSQPESEDISLQEESTQVQEKTQTVETEQGSHIRWGGGV